MHAQSCLTATLDYSPPGSCVYGISQARILEWVAFPPPEDLADLGIKPGSPVSPAFAGRFLTTERPGKPKGVIFQIFEEVNQLCVILET